MIEVQNLKMSYGDVLAVDDVSFEAAAGSIFGLLGPNGAGKSTTIGCISGLLRPSEGSVRVLGHDVVRDGSAARASLGIVPQELALYEDLSARENLAYWGAAYGLRGDALKQRVNEVLAIISLEGRAKEPSKNFSGGMQRRLNFGCGIVHRPQVLLLDEPTVGVDPQSRVSLLDLVRAEAARGTCVLYTTHYMEEAQDLCQQLAIMDHGKVIALGDMSELRGMNGERDLLRLTGHFDPERITPAVTSLEGTEAVHVETDSVMLAVEDASKRLPAIFKALGEAGAEVRETTLSQPSLESLFIKLTGRELRE
jgi:ABC-2 type transport system ATP-binding protein